MNDRDEAIEPELVPSATAGFVTPGTTLTRMRQVDADVRALDAELTAQRTRLPAPFLQGWAHWRDSWFRFFRDNEGFAQRAWPGTMLEVESYARRLRDWRSGAQRVGAELTTPEVSRPGPMAPALPSLPSLPSVPSLRGLLPGMPDLSPLRDLAQALPEAARALPNPLAPMRDLYDHSPLSAKFWESVKPVAIAGAFAVGGLGLLWVLFNLQRMQAANAPSGGSGSGEAMRDLERLLPMLATRGVVR